MIFRSQKKKHLKLKFKEEKIEFVGKILPLFSSSFPRRLGLPREKEFLSEVRDGERSHSL
jgi:hypothetical protein